MMLNSPVWRLGHPNLSSTELWLVNSSRSSSWGGDSGVGRLARDLGGQGSGLLSWHSTGNQASSRALGHRANYDMDCDPSPIEHPCRK
jgi:hypothetical protein